jgi:hypothetical protein
LAQIITDNRKWQILLSRPNQRSLSATRAVLPFGELAVSGSENGYAALVAPCNPRSDETLLPEWSGNLGGVQRWRSSVAWVFWGKPVFQLDESSNLAG